jgi:hypothetical protein
MYRKLEELFCLNTMTYPSFWRKECDHYLQSLSAETMQSISHLNFNLYFDPFVDCDKENSRNKRSGKIMTSKNG